MADDDPSECLRPFVTCSVSVAALLNRHVRGNLSGIKGDRLRQLAALGRMADSMRPALTKPRVSLHPVLGRFGALLSEDGSGPLRVTMHPFSFLLDKGVPPAGLDLLRFELAEDDAPAFGAASRAAAETFIPDEDALGLEMALDLTRAINTPAIRSAADVEDCLRVLGDICTALAIVGTMMRENRRPRRLPATLSMMFEEVRRCAEDGSRPQPIRVSGAGVVVTFELCTFTPEVPFRIVSITRR